MYRSICVALLLAAVFCPAAQQEIQVVSIEFDGNRSIDAARLRSLMRFCREGAVYRPEALRAETDRLQAFYRESGFLDARTGPPAVEVKSVSGRGEGAFIRIPIAEGPLFALGEVTVRNARVLNVPSMMQLSPIRSGQPYSRRRMSEWRDKIGENYQALGYIRFRAELQEKIDERRHVVDLVLDCNEGKAYRVGKIIIDGDPAMNTSDFKRRLLVSEGGVYNPEMLSLTLHFLNEMRTYAPIRQSDVELTIDDEGARVDLVFHLRPAKKPTSSLEE